MNLLVKATVISSLVVGTGCSAWGGRELSKPTNVLNQVSKEKLTLLDLTESTEENKNKYKDKEIWEKILGSDVSSENGKVKIFANLSEDTGSESYKKINKIKKQCKEKLKVLYSSSSFWDSVSEVKQFCVKNNSDR